MVTLPDKSLSRGYSDDMSGPAIMRRLEIVNELYQFGLFLQRAKYQGKVSDLEFAAREGDATGGSNSSRSGLEFQALQRLDPPAA